VAVAVALHVVWIFSERALQLLARAHRAVGGFDNPVHMRRRIGDKPTRGLITGRS
jgi:hypothetical protein